MASLNLSRDELLTAGFILLAQSFCPLLAALRLIEERNMPTVLIVDDYSAVRSAIRAGLERHSGFSVCGEAVGGMDAIETGAGARLGQRMADGQMGRRQKGDCDPRGDGIQGGKGPARPAAPAAS